jgi:hypothetical protein
VLWCSRRPAVLFSQNKSAINNWSALLLSQNKPTSAISHQPNKHVEAASTVVARMGPVTPHSFSSIRFVHPWRFHCWGGGRLVGDWSRARLAFGWARTHFILLPTISYRSTKTIAVQVYYTGVQRGLKDCYDFTTSISTKTTVLWCDLSWKWYAFQVKTGYVDSMVDDRPRLKRVTFAYVLALVAVKEKMYKKSRHD